MLADGVYFPHRAAVSMAIMSSSLVGSMRYAPAGQGIRTCVRLPENHSNSKSRRESHRDAKDGPVCYSTSRGGKGVNLWKNQAEETGKHDGTGATSAQCPPTSASSKRPASAAGADGRGPRRIMNSGGSS